MSYSFSVYGIVGNNKAKQLKTTAPGAVRGRCFMCGYLHAVNVNFNHN
nr:MAG TPA: Cytochrome c oxidase subunit 1 [Caudoviricetes sp.]